MPNGPEYLIFLSNWAFITYNLYLFISAISTTASYLSTYLSSRDERDFSREDEFAIKKPSGCCGYADNKISWYQMIHWLFFTIGNEMAFIIMILYWTLLYDGESVDGINANTHLVNGLIAFLDFWISGVPVNLLHIIYLVTYGAVYTVMTGIYFAASNESVYPVLDYDEEAGPAVGLIFATIFLILPILHSFFFFMYLGKVWMMYCCFGRKEPVININEDQRRRNHGGSSPPLYI